MTAHLNLVRHSPDRIIEANRGIQADTSDHAALKIGIGVAMFLVMLALVWLDGIPRAFDRPAGCERLTPADCTALQQEAR